MPRLPRVSGAEAVGALERLGFRVVRQRGSQSFCVAALRDASFRVTAR